MRKVTYELEFFQDVEKATKNCEAAKKMSLPAWYLDEPLWSIGSKLCSKRTCHRCPIEKLCRKNFNVKFEGANNRTWRFLKDLECEIYLERCILIQVG